VLVSRIERWLAPTGATIKSPDHIPEIASGELREVDVSIRHVVGSAEILITVECRDRSKKQGKDWIQELAAKRELIGAAKTIAVSSSGFSKTVFELARRYGIELRTIESVTQQELEAWVRSYEIVIFGTYIDFLSLKIKLDREPGEPEADIRSDVRKSFKSDPLNTAFGRDTETGNPLTVSALVDCGLEKGDPPFDDIVLGAPPKRICATIGFLPKRFLLFSEHGDIPLHTVELSVKVAFLRSAAPMPRVLRYQKPTETVIEIGEVRIPTSSGDKVLILSKEEPTDEFSEEDWVIVKTNPGSYASLIEFVETNGELHGDATLVVPITVPLNRLLGEIQPMKRVRKTRSPYDPELGTAAYHASIFLKDTASELREGKEHLIINAEQLQHLRIAHDLSKTDPS
jgi:hypothetical protein